jgi:galactose mutarotase-like enzyme
VNRINTGRVAIDGMMASWAELRRIHLHSGSRAAPAPVEDQRNPRPTASLTLHHPDGDAGNFQATTSAWSNRHRPATDVEIGHHRSADADELRQSA